MVPQRTDEAPPPALTMQSVLSGLGEGQEDGRSACAGDGWRGGWKGWLRGKSSQRWRCSCCWLLRRAYQPTLTRPEASTPPARPHPSPVHKQRLHTHSASKSVCVEPLPSAQRCAHAHAQLLLIHPCDASAQTQVDEIISSFCRREVGFYSLYSTFSLEYEISLFLYVEGQISAWPRGKHSHGGRIGELRHVQTIILGVDLEVLQARNENWSAGMLPRVSWGIRSGSVHTYKNGIFPQ